MQQVLQTMAPELPVGATGFSVRGWTMAHNGLAPDMDIDIIDIIDIRMA